MDFQLYIDLAVLFIQDRMRNGNAPTIKLYIDLTVLYLQPRPTGRSISVDRTGWAKQMHQSLTNTLISQSWSLIPAQCIVLTQWIDPDKANEWGQTIIILIIQPYICWYKQRSHQALSHTETSILFIRSDPEQQIEQAEGREHTNHSIIH